MLKQDGEKAAREGVAREVVVVGGAAEPAQGAGLSSWRGRAGTQAKSGAFGPASAPGTARSAHLGCVDLPSTTMTTRQGPAQPTVRPRHPLTELTD